MVQWLLVNWHTQHSSQSLIFILILTLTLLVSLPASGAIIRCLRAGCAFLRACTRAKTRASKGAQSVFCVIKLCARAPLSSCGQIIRNYGKILREKDDASNLIFHRSSQLFSWQWDGSFQFKQTFNLCISTCVFCLLSLFHKADIKKYTVSAWPLGLSVAANLLVLWIWIKPLWVPDPLSVTRRSHRGPGPDYWCLCCVSSFVSPLTSFCSEARSNLILIVFTHAETE